jgi:hypothetical protein
LQGSHGRMSSRSHRQQWRRLSVIEPNDTMNYFHRISRRGPKNTCAHSNGLSFGESKPRLGSYRCPRPSQIGSHEDRARTLCKSPAALQGLTAIGIPSRKTPARHIGPRCSIRGKSGRGRTGGEPYRRVGQTSGPSQSRRTLRVAETLRFFLL